MLEVTKMFLLWSVPNIKLSISVDQDFAPFIERYQHQHTVRPKRHCAALKARQSQARWQARAASRENEVAKWALFSSPLCSSLCTRTSQGFECSEKLVHCGQMFMTCRKQITFPMWYAV